MANLAGASLGSVGGGLTLKYCEIPPSTWETWGGNTASCALGVDHA